MTTIGRLLRIVVRVALPVVATSVCGGGAGDGVGVSTELCSITSVSIAPAATEVVIGTPVTLVASVASSHCDPAPVVTWESTVQFVATVSNTGVVTALGPGSTTIKASAGGKTGTAAITVHVPVATLTVSAPGTSVVVGSTLQVTAQAKDANGNILTGRTFAWQSSNPTVASIDQNGIINALTAGSVVITATADGKTATLNVTVTGAATLSITSITPASGAADIGVESTIRVNFSAALNAATVNANSLRVTSGGATVPGALAVSGSTITFTPAPLLTEFRTTYTVTVTVDVLSSVGNHLPSEVTSSFATAFWDPAYYYRITNQFMGALKSLDVFSDTFGCSFGNTGSFSGQYWYFTPLTAPGYYSMRNQFQGETKALEGGDVGIACFLNGSLGGALFSGQLWKPVAYGAAFPGGYRLQTLYLGTAKSLDTPLIGGVQRPGMAVTGNFTGQVWYFTRLDHK